MSSLKHYVLQNRSSGQGVEVQRIMIWGGRQEGWHVKYGEGGGWGGLLIHDENKMKAQGGVRVVGSKMR